MRKGVFGSSMNSKGPDQWAKPHNLTIDLFYEVSGWLSC